MKEFATDRERFSQRRSPSDRLVVIRARKNVATVAFCNRCEVCKHKNFGSRCDG